MAIAYPWTCSGCGAGNPAGTDVCTHCGINAITSGEEIQQHRGVATIPKPSVRLRQLYKFIAGCAVLAIFIGGFLERFTFPTMTVWYIAIGLLAVGGLVLWAIHLRHESRANAT